MRAHWGKTAALLFCFSRLTLAADSNEDISSWDFSLNAREGVGYKDNILLSDFNRESSVFSLTTVDFFAYHLPLNGWEFSGLLTAEDRRYWQSSSVDKEQLVITSAEVKRTLGDSWKIGLRAQYFYNDQVFDASVTEGFPLRILAKLHQFSGGPSVQWEMPGKRRLELSGEIERQNFEGFVLDDSWQAGPKLIFGQGYGNKSEFTATFQFRDRTYDRRSAPGGSESLNFEQSLFELGVKHYWDKKREWKSRGRAGLETNADNGSGYYDYYRWRLSHELAYTHRSWEASLETKLLYYQYQHQLSINGDLRSRTEFFFGAKVEKTIWKRLSLFGEAEYEWVMDSDRFDEYRTFTLVGGVEVKIK